MNKIIEEAVKNGIPITMEYDKTTQKINYIIYGFYKSGQIVLFEEEHLLIAEARYNERTTISKFNDLVLLNFQWWRNYKDNHDGWKNPESAWLPFFIELGLVTPVTTTNYIIK